MTCGKNHTKSQNVTITLPIDRGIGCHKYAVCAYAKGYLDRVTDSY